CYSPPCSECGSGPHWIHNPNCPPGGKGSDTVSSGATVGIDFNGDCIADQVLTLGGPVTIGKRGPADDSANFPGTRPVDGHIDAIDTQISAMMLPGGGVTLRAGPYSGSAQPLQPSLGAVAEKPSNPNLADSFFDVFVEVDFGGGSRGYNTTPIRMAQTI